MVCYRVEHIHKTIGARISFELSDSDNQRKVWRLDSTTKNVTVTIGPSIKDPNDPWKPDLRLQCSDDHFYDLCQGKMSPEMAVMRGLLKVKGSVLIATKIKSLIALTSKV